MPLAIAELQELAAQIKKETINIIDVIKNIDEMNYTKKDEEQYKKRTITLTNSLKSLHEKKGRDEEAGRPRPMSSRKTGRKEAPAIEAKIEESLANLGLQKKVLEEITRRVEKQLEVPRRKGGRPWRRTSARWTWSKGS